MTGIHFKEKHRTELFERFCKNVAPGYVSIGKFGLQRWCVIRNEYILAK